MNLLLHPIQVKYTCGETQIADLVCGLQLEGDRYCEGHGQTRCLVAQTGCQNLSPLLVSLFLYFAEMCHLEDPHQQICLICPFPHHPQDLGRYTICYKVFSYRMAISHVILPSCVSSSTTDHTFLQNTRIYSPNPKPGHTHIQPLSCSEFKQLLLPMK